MTRSEHEAPSRRTRPARRLGRVAGARRLALVTVIGLLAVAGCVADAPPSIGLAVAGNGQATVSWTAPLGDTAKTLIGYEVTPYIGAEPQGPRVFANRDTTQTVT